MCFFFGDLGVRFCMSYAVYLYNNRWKLYISVGIFTFLCWLFHPSRLLLEEATDARWRSHLLYDLLYIKDRMNIRSQVDGRLPYTAPSAELFALAAASPSLLVSFSANIDEEFDNDVLTDGILYDDPPL